MNRPKSCSSCPAPNQSLVTIYISYLHILLRKAVHPDQNPLSASVPDCFFIFLFVHISLGKHYLCYATDSTRLVVYDKMYQFTENRLILAQEKLPNGVPRTVYTRRVISGSGGCENPPPAQTANADTVSFTALRFSRSSNQNGSKAVSAFRTEHPTHPQEVSKARHLPHPAAYALLPFFFTQPSRFAGCTPAIRVDLAGVIYSIFLPIIGQNDNAVHVIFKQFHINIIAADTDTGGICYESGTKTDG